MFLYYFRISFKLLEMQYLDEIAERFYNVPRRNGMQGMLGDFMKVLHPLLSHLSHLSLFYHVAKWSNRGSVI